MGATFRVFARKGKTLGEPMSGPMDDPIEANQVGRALSAATKKPCVTVRDDGAIIAVHCSTYADRKWDGPVRSEEVGK